MRILSISSVAAVALCALTAVGARHAYADIVVQTSADALNTDNVLMNAAADALTATGTVAGHTVQFTSSSGSGLLNASAAGQQPLSGGTGNSPLTNLTMRLTGDLPFTKTVFNINAGADGSALLHVEGINISGGFYEDDFFIDASGENFFTVTAINGQFITSMTLTAVFGATFEDVRQFRIGGAPAIPEPASALLLGGSLAGFLLLGRQTKRTRTTPPWTLR